MSSDKRFSSTPETAGIGLEGIEMTQQMSVAAAEYGQRICALQVEAAHAAFAANATQFKHWLQSIADTADALMQWPGLFRPKTQNFVEITRGWLDVVAQTTAEMTQLMSESLSTSLTLAEKNYGTGTYPERDRRVAAQVISFPDRRRVAVQPRDEAGEAAESEPKRKRSGTA